MSLYSRYLQEREGLETLETSHGFVSYKFRPDGCYIQDIYTLPECRKSGEASQLADKVAALAKSLGYRNLIGSVDSRANGAEISVKVLLSYGMKPYTQEGFVTYFSKEI